MNIEIVKDVYSANAITHSLTFHADDVLSTVFLSKIFDKVRLCRTRFIPNDIDKNKVLIYDVGGGRFDHHQKGGNGCRPNGIPYSSAGLIWKKFGMDILNKVPSPKEIFDIIDRELVSGIDATDCGKRIKLKDGEAKNMTISSIIFYMNSIDGDSDEDFLKAVEIMNIVYESLLKTAICDVSSGPYVEDAIQNSDGKILVLDKYMPWQDTLFSSKNPKAKTIMFAIFPDKEGGYRWQTVPTKLGGYTARKEVPISWRGLNSLDYSKITGLPDVKFCHPNGFIGGAWSLESTIELVEMAIRE